ncbi:hypothetical protein HD554DRAFT_2175592 [Boletus coccyginus]|nr:hypothetical protein HD554DRAFT_2175592 [Boletus coccyginus]
MQSIPGLEDIGNWIPRNTTLVGEIKPFLPMPEGFPVQSGLIELKNGTVLSGIDSAILATGFRYLFPFLPQCYDGASTHIRDLHLDQFICGIPLLHSLGFFDYTTLALAKVWTNMAKPPRSQTMRALYDKVVEERGGHGKYFLYLDPERSAGKSIHLLLRLSWYKPSAHVLARVAHSIGWLNVAAVGYGGQQSINYRNTASACWV